MCIAWRWRYHSISTGWAASWTSTSMRRARVIGLSGLTPERSKLGLHLPHFPVLLFADCARGVLCVTALSQRIPDAGKLRVLRLVGAVVRTVDDVFDSAGFCLRRAHRRAWSVAAAEKRSAAR